MLKVKWQQTESWQQEHTPSFYMERVPGHKRYVFHIVMYCVLYSKFLMINSLPTRSFTAMPRLKASEQFLGMF